MRFRHIASLLTLIALATAIPPAPHQRAQRTGRGSFEPREEPEDAVGLESAWFVAQRAYPGSEIPHALYLQAAQQARVDFAAALSSSAASRSVSVAPLQWQNAGPNNIGGRVTALAATPGGPIYLGSANGGVFKSTNGGTNWTPIFDNNGIYSIGALALDPNNSSTLYVGTGEANSSVDSYDGNGLYRSTDAGQSWLLLGLEATRRIGRVAVDPSNSSRIFVAAMGTQFSTGPDRGLYRSEDGGASWSQVLFVSDSTGACDVVINPAHPETLYCATWERVRRYTYRRAYGPECGIWRSADHGSTWTLLAGGLPAPSNDVGRIGLAIAPSRPSTVYAQIVSGVSLGYVGLGFYRSLDGGQNWTRRDVGNFSGNFGGNPGFGWYFGDVVVDPANADIVYSLGVSLIRSSDGGANWSFMGSTHADQHALWIDPVTAGHQYGGNDGGFFSTVNGGGGWTKSVDLPITQFYAGAIDPSNSSRLLGGTQDNNTLQTSTGPGSWTVMLGGDGFQCLVDPTNPLIVFAEYQFGSYGAGLQRSTNGGTAFGSPSGFVGSDRFNWDSPIAMNPRNHNVLLMGSQRVYKSTNNGLSYAIVSGDLTKNLPASLTFSTLSTLEISNADTSLYYAGSDDGKVWRSNNGGGSWTDISAGLPVRYVTRVATDPANANVVYVTVSGFEQDEHAAHVYRSVDQGANWTSISTNLPNAPANDLIVDPADSNTLYLATDVGVYATRNLGGGWFPLGFGMPEVEVVDDLTLHAPTRTLVAATHGRSQWKLDLSGLPVAASGAVPPPALALSAPAPNPSHGTARFTLDLPREGRVDVAIFDPQGRRVATLLRANLAPGRRELVWSGEDAAGRATWPGVYYLRAAATGAVVTRRLVRL
ncbi:MAG: hypothetical protein HYR73_02235 [Candidatus Eisenbacteria bacterium]|nr:hypothetical protein [Candidatus Eisenbacteria bacterium]